MQHVWQPVLTGEPGGSPEFRPGLLALAQPGQGAAVRRERRGQDGDPRLPLRDCLPSVTASSWWPRSRAIQPRWAVYQAFWCG